MLVAHDAQGRAARYLLASPDDRSVSRGVLPFVAEPVEVTGRLERTADLLVVHVDPSTIRRL